VTRAGTRTRIVHAATQLFAKRGFAGTTTRDIAKMAGLNEALVFYYFGRKQNLYWTVLEQTRRDSHFVESLRKRLSATADGTASIGKLVEFMMEHNERDDTLFRLLLLTGLQDDKNFRSLSGRFFKTHLHISYDLVAEYVAKQIRAGKFRKVDPMIASRALFSLAAYHHVIQEFLGGKQAQRYSTKRVSRALADLWLRAMTNFEDGRTG
jgi:AcrR family transcriptional regulator